MNTLEQCLGLVNSGEVTRQEAMGKASNIKVFLWTEALSGLHLKPSLKGIKQQPMEQPQVTARSTGIGKHHRKISKGRVA